MKILYQLISLVAIVNLLILAGLVGYLVTSGRLNSESAQSIAAVLRGEKLSPAVGATTTAPATTQPATQPAGGGRDTLLDSIEMQLALLDREKRSVEDRYSRLRDAELKLIRDRESLTHREETFTSRVKDQKESSEDEGFAKAVQFYSQLPAKAAKDDFMKTDVDVVVRFLMNMPKRPAASILQEFKTAEEQKRRQEILDRVRTQQMLLDPGPRQAEGR